MHVDEPLSPMPDDPPDEVDILDAETRPPESAGASPIPPNPPGGQRDLLSARGTVPPEPASASPIPLSSAGQSDVLKAQRPQVERLAGEEPEDTSP